MFKKFLCLALVFITCFSFCACDEDEITETQTPEEAVKDFLTAMYSRDAERFVKHFPEYTHEAILKMTEITAEDGDTHKAILNYFKEQYAEEPVKVEEIKIETRLSTAFTKEDYMKIVKEYYLSEGFIIESDIEKIEDVVFVDFNSSVKYEGGGVVNLENFEQQIPCVKVEGKWYVDFLYATMTIKVEKNEHKVTKPTN